MRELALFAGIGGGILGGQLLRWRTSCAVEIDPYCRSVLLARQRDGMLPRFPIWDDIRTFEGYRWRGSIDVVTGGFPCQDISAAGKGAGITGKRSGLWFEMLRVVEEVRPEFVFAENSPNLRTRGLGVMLQGLASLGYDCRWCVLGARHVGANHRRSRMWLLAHTNVRGERISTINAEMARTSKISEVVDEASNACSIRLERSKRERKHCSRNGTQREEEEKFGRSSWWDFPNFAGVDAGNANRMDRIKATGNAQVPAVAALAWEVLSQGLLY